MVVVSFQQGSEESLHVNIDGVGKTKRQTGFRGFVYSVLKV